MVPPDGLPEQARVEFPCYYNICKVIILLSFFKACYSSICRESSSQRAHFLLQPGLYLLLLLIEPVQFPGIAGVGRHLLVQPAALRLQLADPCFADGQLPPGGLLAAGCPRGGRVSSFFSGAFTGWGAFSCAFTARYWAKPMG